MLNVTNNLNVKNAQVNSLFSLSYITLSSLEIKSVTELVSRLKEKTQFRETFVNNLKALIRQLQYEWVLCSLELRKKRANND